MSVAVCNLCLSRLKSTAASSMGLGVVALNECKTGGYREGNISISINLDQSLPSRRT